ncbi:hypothetical protein [Paludibacterium denitrificans]|uniref:Lipoprotein n=1 Tax=Paludibacterium denitrificans TaxID=2675226 RepID=A0A844GFT1_9NEIS|nr:hypothetical protein [Paludibacterium denitrificans]MTD33544.1 hypothetical protein [Paludibacterium denitrificans]
MMKPLWFVLLCAVSASSPACTFKTSDSDNIREIARQHGGYPISDAQCKFLNERGLALSIRGNATVLSGVSMAWVNVSLANLKTGIKSDSYRYSNSLDTSEASQTKADDLLYSNLSDAIGAFDFATAAREMENYRNKRK